jgi:hypothetical protein
MKHQFGRRRAQERSALRRFAVSNARQAGDFSGYWQRHMAA